MTGKMGRKGYRSLMTLLCDRNEGRGSGGMNPPQSPIPRSQAPLCLRLYHSGRDVCQVPLFTSPSTSRYQSEIVAISAAMPTKACTMNNQRSLLWRMHFTPSMQAPMVRLRLEAEKTICNILHSFPLPGIPGCTMTSGW
jgi:hypothetical protein